MGKWPLIYKEDLTGTVDQTYHEVKTRLKNGQPVLAVSAVTELLEIVSDEWVEQAAVQFPFVCFNFTAQDVLSLPRLPGGKVSQHYTSSVMRNYWRLLRPHLRHQVSRELLDGYLGAID